jgi:hypothetical protein
MAIGGNTALDPFRKPAINLQREGSLAFRDRSSSPSPALQGQKLHSDHHQRARPKPAAASLDSYAANTRYG